MKAERKSAQRVRGIMQTSSLAIAVTLRPLFFLISRFKQQQKKNVTEESYV